MIYSDLHTHTTYCDGKDTPEQMIKSAIEKGLKEIGLCVHCYTAFDENYCPSPEEEKEFQKEVRALQKKYADKISVRLGIEQDIFATYKPSGYDYVIGSAHFFKIDGKYYYVDYKKDYFVDLVNTKFNGDYYLAVENYFENVSKICEITKPDIIAHIDLINKFNEGDNLFSTEDIRYKRASEKAVLKLLKYNIPFEINTGAISRGYRKEPYPNKGLYEFIKKNGGKFILSSDSHSAENIAFKFSEYSHLV